MKTLLKNAFIYLILFFHPAYAYMINTAHKPHDNAYKLLYHKFSQKQPRIQFLRLYRTIIVRKKLRQIFLYKRFCLKEKKRNVRLHSAEKQSEFSAASAVCCAGRAGVSAASSAAGTAGSLLYCSVHILIQKNISA